MWGQLQPIRESLNKCREKHNQFQYSTLRELGINQNVRLQGRINLGLNLRQGLNNR